MLEGGSKAFLAALKTKRLKASFELWHNRLGHASFDIISLLNKLGLVAVTSVTKTRFVFFLSTL